MHIEAVIPKTDLEAFLNSALPFDVDLPGKSKFIHVQSLLSIALVEGEGVRIEVSGSVEWPVLGIPFPVTATRLGVLLTPRVQIEDGLPRLGFTVKVEEADLKNIPGLVEDIAIDAANSALSEATLPSWAFTKTVDFSIPMPAVVLAPQRLVINATDGSAITTTDAVIARVMVRAMFERASGVVSLPHQIEVGSTP